MTPDQFHASRKTIATPSGEISFIERGKGPVALFIHGVPLNGYHWRHALMGLSDLRRCLAPDLMGLGHTKVAADQSVRFDAQAQMLLEFIYALGIDKIDLVGNDSGGAIAQLLAVKAPDRIRSLVLTNCDVHDNWPPEAFKPAVELAKVGQFSERLVAALVDPAGLRAGGGLGVAYQFPEALSDDLVAVYLAPLTALPERRALVDRYVASFDCAQTVNIYAQLKALNAPTLVVWGDSDIFFPVRWSHWLGETIPGTRKVVVLEGAKLFFPEERSAEFCTLVRAHWQAAA